MPSRIALLASVLLMTAPAFARNTTPSGPEICREAIPTIREAWQHDIYDAPPVVAALMVDVIDGKLPQTRERLGALTPAEARRWRQTAMLTAVNTGQAAIVDALLDDGAAVDGTGWLPPFKPDFYRQTVDSMKRDPRLRPNTGDGFATRGLLTNQGQHYGPALPIAAECGDVATVDVLLRHHANVMARQAPNIADALDMAIVNGDAAIVQRLLDHGATACPHDRLGRARMLKAKRKFTPLAEIGRRAGLPAALAARLSCPAVAATH
jgi:hypothetical protein